MNIELWATDAAPHCSFLASRCPLPSYTDISGAAYWTALGQMIFSLAFSDLNDNMTGMENKLKEYFHLDQFHILFHRVHHMIVQQTVGVEGRVSFL